MLEKLKINIAGEIAMSETPGATMKKWREIFELTQAELADYLDIVPSTISDYEGNRRTSPGTAVVRRLVDAIIDIDVAKGGKVSSRLVQEVDKIEEYYQLHEFAASITAYDFAKLIEGEVISNEDLIASKKVYGYTLINSLKVILDLPHNQYPKLYGAMSERAFIFTEVSTGRSPMVVIRVSAMKPSVVVLHNIEDVDKIALKIAEKEQIPVIISKMDIEKIKRILNRI